MGLQRFKYNYLRTWLKLKSKQIISIISSKQQNYTRFIILCSPRTGSTLLHTYLNSHPNIISHGEVLRRKPSSRIHVGSSIFKKYGSNIKAVGLKVFYEYATDKEYKGAYEQLAYDPIIKVIHIVREDIKSQFLSLQNAEKTGDWNASDIKPYTYDKEIDPNKFNSFIRKVDKERSDSLRHFSNHSSLVISYEKLINDKENTLNQIQKFLNVEPRQLSTLLVKVRSEVVD